MSGGEDLFRRLFDLADRSQGSAQLGLAFAEVTGRSDDGFTLGYYSGNLDAASAPARVATLMAGGGRGAFFMPEVGDEVVVGFEMGDLSRPVILGALWSDVDSPPSQADTSDSNNVRTIVSRAGHEVTFDDTPGAGKIVIKTAGGFHITLDDGPSPKIQIETTGNVASSRIELDGVAWNHQHATGTGPSGPPVSIVPVV